jgi:ferredoxin-NADP reductase/Na+-translocating ferredoxin:NAD+ oxidoreductase RnfD subunit
VGLCFLGVLSFKPLDLIISIVILTVVSLAANKIFASVFGVPANSESDYITAWILALIITPPAVSGSNYFSGLAFLAIVAALAQASKYFLAYKGKHIFNPAAFGVVATAFAINQAASWWVGVVWMLPVVLIGGLLVVRKIQRFDLVLSFLAVAIGSIIALSPSRSDSWFLLRKILVDSPILFFAFIMLTEPMTTPPKKLGRILYGGFAGLLFGPLIHIGSFYATPELALAAANIFSYMISPKAKHLLTLKSKNYNGADTYDLIFHSKHPLQHEPGQYMEWTVGHKKPDTRGNRRYFTIASSPTENDVRLGVKSYSKPSSFKKALFALPAGSQVLAGQLAGDFTMPKDPAKKLVFIAGGIGITPFRSMIKYLLDSNEKRDIAFFYSNKTSSEIAYKEILDQAEIKLGIKTVYIQTENSGRLTGEMISEHLRDYKDRTYYISGPRGMVAAFEKTLKHLGIPRAQIKVDFFPGFV